VVDAQNSDCVPIVVDLVDHSICPSSRGVETGEFAQQTPADAVWIIDHGTEHELDDRSCGTFGESAEVSLRWAGDAKFVGFVVLGHLEAKRARSSSPVM